MSTSSPPLCQSLEIKKEPVGELPTPPVDRLAGLAPDAAERGCFRGFRGKPEDHWTHPAFVRVQPVFVTVQLGAVEQGVSNALFQDSV